VCLNTRINVNSAFRMVDESISYPESWDCQMFVICGGMPAPIFVFISTFWLNELWRGRFSIAIEVLFSVPFSHAWLNKRNGVKFKCVEGKNKKQKQTKLHKYCVIMSGQLSTNRAQHARLPHSEHESSSKCPIRAQNIHIELKICGKASENNYLQ